MDEIELGVAIGALQKGQEVGAGDRENIKAMVRTLAKEMKKWRIAESEKQTRRHEENQRASAALKERLDALDAAKVARALALQHAQARRERWAKIVAATITVLAGSAAAGVAVANYFFPHLPNKGP